MIHINELLKFFPKNIQDKPHFYEYMLKDYFHYKILNIIFNSKYSGKLCFIGGTCLRIIHNIERFSEDLDFDHFNLSHEEFTDLTNTIIIKLQNEGIDVVADDKDKDKILKAFRRNLIYPKLLFNQGLSGHKEKRFLIKIESEAHKFKYDPDKTIIQKFNIFTQIHVAPIDILLSMKIGAVLERKKGRDFYDCMQLMGLTEPNWSYLAEKFNIHTPSELTDRILKSVQNVNFENKSKEFQKLIFNPDEANKVKLFIEYIKQKKIH